MGHGHEPTIDASILTYPNIWGSLTPELYLQFSTHHIVENTMQNWTPSALGSDGAMHAPSSHLKICRKNRGNIQIRIWSSL
jgi:hypothetical protein